MAMKSPETKFKTSEIFELKIQDFLKNMGFVHVRGGRNNRIGGIQVDVGGGFGDTYVVIDCHTSIEARRKSIRLKIKQIRGDRQLIRRGMKDDRILRQYRHLKLVVCTQNVQLGPNDRSFANNAPKVHLWDENFVRYYESLAQKIGNYAKYGLIGELEIPPTDEIPVRELEVPAFKTTVRGKTLFLFWAKPDILMRIAFVARREVGREEYYQRLLRKDRLADISRYISDERRKTLFPNAIIMNFRVRPKFHKSKRVGKGFRSRFGWLMLPDKYRSAWVIDGQHRLYSFSWNNRHSKDMVLPVVAFCNLPEDKQAEFFLKINKEQRPVDPNLLWDLEGSVHPSSEEGVIANTVKTLDRKGPLSGLISYPNLGADRKDRPLGLANLCDAIYARRITEPQTEHMFSKMRNPLYSESAKRKLENLTDGLNIYMNAVKETFPEDWEAGNSGFFRTNNGMSVLIRLYERCIAYKRKKHKKKELKELLSPLAEYFDHEYEKPGKVGELRTSCSSEGIRGKVAEEFSAVIKEKFPDFHSEIQKPESWEERFADFELRLKKSLACRIGDDIQIWWNSKAESLRNRVESRKPKGTEPWLRMTLGEWKDFIAPEEFWNEYLKVPCSSVFDDRMWCVNHFSELADYRNIVQHGGTLTDHQRTVTMLYISEFEKVIDKLDACSTQGIQS
jgi:DGQHR domain-containing protein